MFQGMVHVCINCGVICDICSSVCPTLRHIFSMYIYSNTVFQELSKHPYKTDVPSSHVSNIGKIGHRSEEESPDQRMSSHWNVPCGHVSLYIDIV